MKLFHFDAQSESIMSSLELGELSKNEQDVLRNTLTFVNELSPSDIQFEVAEGFGYRDLSLYFVNALSCSTK